MSDGGHGLTADMVARGLIVACRRFGSDPVFVFDRSKQGGGKARACVGAALKAHLERHGQTKATTRAAAIVSLPPTGIAPSNLARAGITGLDVTVVEHALVAAERAPQSPKAAAAPARKGRTLFRPPSVTQARPAPVRSPNAVAFDPAVLKGKGRIGVAAPKYEETPRAPRQPDVERSDAAIPDHMDDALVKACRKAGGFPIVTLTGPYRGALVAPDQKSWGHA